ncbi:MAG: phosphoglucosamine mutase [Candidatus Schekmanbacteria bacterium]|nr:phosphoglucosamine mutase [Candidatus Schekmanbacteria bacterium]
MRKLFGTDGVRGVANIEPMTVETALKLGRAAAYVFRRSPRRHRIVIGKDTRLSGYMLESALVAGICSMGVDVLLVGPMPTPAISFITRTLRADAGVVISASHNPYEDNGIKFFSSDGFKLPDELELEIEQLVTNGKIDSIRPTATEIGKAYRIDDAEGRYIESLKNSFPRGLDLEGYKLVLDCANGAAYKVTPKALTELGAKVIVLHDRPDGTNINHKCGSLHPEVIQEAVLTNQAQMGISLDGDADRAILVDEKGNLVDGDHIMAVCAQNLARRNKLCQNTLVTTVMSNLGLEIALRKMGINIVKTPVGDRYVMQKMREKGYNLGGEQSGHVIFLDHSSSGDGSLTSLQMLAIMAESQQPLSVLAACMTTLPQILINLEVKGKKDLAQLPSVQQAIRDAEKVLGEKGRVLVRYSGTQSLVRVMVEGESRQQIEQLGECICMAIVQCIGKG